MNYILKFKTIEYDVCCWTRNTSKKVHRKYFLVLTFQKKVRWDLIFWQFAYFCDEECQQERDLKTKIHKQQQRNRTLQWLQRYHKLPGMPYVGHEVLSRYLASWHFSPQVLFGDRHFLCWWKWNADQSCQWIENWSLHEIFWRWLEDGGYNIQFSIAVESPS